MSTAYLTSENGRLSYTNEKLVFSNREKEEVTLFPHLIDTIAVNGLLNITGAAIRFLMEKEIPVFFMSKNGKYEGRLSFGESKNVFVRNCQHNIVSDVLWRFENAKSIVRGKIRNQARFLERRCEESTDYLTELNNLRYEVKNVESMEELRGMEGMASHIYFDAMKKILPSWTNFNGRNRNPPMDVANAVFSFVYTLLSYRIETALITSGLDPAVGILHSFAYSRNSLVFDLIEEFRSPLADSVCCSLFSLKILDAKDFSFESQNDEKQYKAVYLTKNGIGKVIERFEKKLMKKIQVAGENRKMTYDSLIKYQAMQYKNCVMTGTIYNPVYIR